MESTSLPIATQFKGIAIGNGCIDPATQYPAYAEFAFDRNIVDKKSAHGKTILEHLSKCQEKLKEEVHIHVPECEQILNSIIDATVVE